MTQPRAIQSVAELVHDVCELPEPDPGTDWWYRGHTSNLPQTVAPVATRDQVGSGASGAYRPETPHGPLHSAEQALAREQLINREFRSRGMQLLPPDTDLVDLYFLARHHGLPSRLLDWTENPLFALFLAVAGESGRDGEILAATPADFARLNGAAAPEARRHEPSHEASARAVRNTVEVLFGERNPGKLFDGLPFSTPAILPIVPDQRQSRLARQGARFTLHMPGCPELSKLHLRRWRIPAAAKAPLRRELRKLALRWDSFFPDLDHLARELSERAAIA